MPPAAVLFSPTAHPGVIVGPGVLTVRIGGMPAVTVGDQHVCGFPVPPGHPPNVISQGSTKVRIAKRFAARVGDLCACGAPITAGIPTVNIG
ncbi:MAG: PAAR domain-containing protein [Proteobacteria bacterium]|nr:PAAR domain-containing protein [Pseudomonadota bacterium]